MVIIPLEVSYSSALREMSTDLPRSPVEISGRTPAYAPARSSGVSARREERVDGVEQVRDVLLGGPDVHDVAAVVGVRRADQRLAEPRQHEDRPAEPAGTIAPARQRQLLARRR